ncbi:RluA family pseudouridine synthase [Spiroplasma endosymbiont of Anurida maritima]|uniref:RluA family pseudouridine synthase n=1 Tax=Spiroplasma endosymbiont of Anurida maritima TaxID=2967972 RepID=UPI0036D23065
MNNNRVTLNVSTNDAGQTIFSFVKKMYKKMLITEIYKLFRNKDIKINGKKTKDRKVILEKDDVIEIYYPNINKFESTKIVKKINFDFDYSKINIEDWILYEDDNLMLVNKPHGWEVHSNFNMSLDGLLQYKYSQKYKNENNFKISHINRIDKYTSGIVLYAKNLKALSYFNKNISKVSKKYLAKVQGVFPEVSVVEGYIYKNEDNNKMIFNKTEYDDAQFAKTRFKVLERYIDFSIIEIELLTGRKHQIRATLNYLKHPVVNDVKYGAKHVFKAPKIELYSYYVGFKELDNGFEYLNGKIIVNEKLINEVNL